MNGEECCGRCHFYEPDVCRRFPPTTIMMPEGTALPTQPMIISVWRQVDVTEWCGEFKRRIAPPPPPDD